MPSKYDKYWLSIIDQIKIGIERAIESNDAVIIDVKEMQNYGKRESWYGVVCVSTEGMEGGQMAHARSLGNVVIEQNVLQDRRIRFRILNSFQLIIEVMLEGDDDRQIQAPAEFPVIQSRPNVNQRNVICFIPCSRRKNQSGMIIQPPSALSEQDLPYLWQDLLMGRQEMHQNIDNGSRKTSAIYLYAGSFYRAITPYKEEIIKTIKAGRLRVIIVSAGYGVVDAFEPIHNYNEEMKGRTASIWRAHNLESIIADFLLQKQPARIFGFFPGERYWSTPSAKYRYFFTEGLRRAYAHGLERELGGCFYRKQGRGVGAILGGLGRTLVEFFQSGFDDAFVQETMQNNRIDGNVTMGFDLITG